MQAVYSDHYLGEAAVEVDACRSNYLVIEWTSFDKACRLMIHRNNIVGVYVLGHQLEIFTPACVFAINGSPGNIEKIMDELMRVL